MTLVLIQPSYGNPAARRHWADTLDREVTFADPPYRELVTDADRARLLELHPTGRARFWGATAGHDANMDRLSTGDVVLFTGQKMIRGVGEIGHRFREPRLADQLWRPDPTRGSWRNVYSVLAFQPTDIRYRELQELIGSSENDNFMGLRLLDESRSNAVLDGLAIDTMTGRSRAAKAEEATVTALVTGTLVDVEAVNTAQTSYIQPGGTQLVHRGESLLVEEYRETLAAPAKRLRCEVGVTDLYVLHSDGAEIVEAKSTSDHAKVREAIAQLLDYSAYADRPLTRLTALFPTRPTARDIGLLHRLGLDCVWRGGKGEYTRAAAPDKAREHMRAVWHAQLPAQVVTPPITAVVGASFPHPVPAVAPSLPASTSPSPPASAVSGRPRVFDRSGPTR